eukprot:365026-Chlamydomonas_euryale.AAC.11
MPDESEVKQLLFAEGLLALGGVVGKLRVKWQDRALAALRPVFTSRLAGTTCNGAPFVTVPCRLLDPFCHATLNTDIPFMGLLPVTLTL